MIRWYRFDVCRTIQNYLTWQLIIDRVNSLSRRFKDARARYRKVQKPGHKCVPWVCSNTHTHTKTVCVIRLFMEPLWRMPGGENVSDTYRAAWRTQSEHCTCVRRLLEKVNEWWGFCLIFLSVLYGACAPVSTTLKVEIQKCNTNYYTWIPHVSSDESGICFFAFINPFILEIGSTNYCWI